MERPQRRCTKLMNDFYYLSYAKRLSKVSLDSMLFRNTIHDLMMGFRVVKGYYTHILPSTFFTFNNDTRNRRCNRYKLQKTNARTNLRKTFWSQRIFDLWNKIPDKFFDAKSPKEFKLYLLNNFKENITNYLESKHKSVRY